MAAPRFDASRRFAHLTRAEFASLDSCPSGASYWQTAIDVAVDLGPTGDMRAVVATRLPSDWMSRSGEVGVHCEQDTRGHHDHSSLDRLLDPGGHCPRGFEVIGPLSLVRWGPPAIRVLEPWCV